MESVIYLLAFVISIIVLSKSGLKEVAWALVLMPIMVIFLIIIVIWQIKKMIDDSKKTYLDILKEKAHEAKKESIKSDADAKISELEKNIVLSENVDDIKSNSENTDVSVAKKDNSDCFMAGQNKNAPGDHIGNKSCRENKLFMNDRCKSKCGVKTDVGMDICCNETCCENKNVIIKQDDKEQYFENDTDLEKVYDQIRDKSDNIGNEQTEKYFNYDPSEPKELNYKNFV
tara:strand:- start:66 stop:755 length:690 start_codon:yes stop_codon:yes gene_type:complete